MVPRVLAHSLCSVLPRPKRDDKFSLKPAILALPSAMPAICGWKLVEPGITRPVFGFKCRLPKTNRLSDAAKFWHQSRTRSFSDVIHNFLVGAGFCTASRVLF
jgi:hypothetical protein